MVSDKYMRGSDDVILCHRGINMRRFVWQVRQFRRTVTLQEMKTGERGSSERSCTSAHQPAICNAAHESTLRVHL